MSEEKKEYKSKPLWLSKTNWGIILAILIVVLGYFGVSTEWLTDMASSIGIAPEALSAVLVAAVNIILKIATWAFYKWIKTDED